MAIRRESALRTPAAISYHARGNMPTYIHALAAPLLSTIAACPLASLFSVLDCLLLPTGCRYGGVHPGHLYSRGKLFETHRVSYSIGRVGRYLLHVRLRSTALALPGSPFALTVSPGPAHWESSSLEPETTPLPGEVGSRGLLSLSPKGFSLSVTHTHT